MRLHHAVFIALLIAPARVTAPQYWTVPTIDRKQTDRTASAIWLIKGMCAKFAKIHISKIHISLLQPVVKSHSNHLKVQNKLTKCALSEAGRNRGWRAKPLIPPIGSEILL
jgi:hypothetical protein